MSKLIGHDIKVNITLTTNDLDIIYDLCVKERARVLRNSSFDDVDTLYSDDLHCLIDYIEQILYN